MAELTRLEDRLGEVMGLAMAARGATAKVAKLVEDEEIVSTLERMGEEAAETERRCADLAGTREGRRTAIREKACRDGLEFLGMAEAGEVGHWEVLGALGERAGDAPVLELVSWALPIQERHLGAVRQGATSLAAAEDPNEPA